MDKYEDDGFLDYVSPQVDYYEHVEPTDSLKTGMLQKITTESSSEVNVVFDSAIQRFAETGEGYAEARAEIDKIIDDAESVEEAKSDIRKAHGFDDVEIMTTSDGEKIAVLDVLDDNGDQIQQITTVDFLEQMSRFGKSARAASEELVKVASKPAPKPVRMPSVKMRGLSPVLVAVDEVKPAPKAPVKKPYVRPEHLTDRPFKNHEGLQALQEKQQAEAKRAREAREAGKSKRPAKKINPRAKRQR